MNAPPARCLLCVLGLLSACGGSGEPPKPGSVRLPEGVVARAGRELISASTVTRIAQAQNLPAARALSHALSDAILAQAAMSSVASGTASHIERAAAARTLLEQLARDATRTGPPSQAELDELSRERWLEVDRPDAARTTHAVVLGARPELLAKARAIAEKLAETVRSAGSKEEFERLAKTVAPEGLTLRVESLPPVTADGRAFERRDDTFQPHGAFDVEFARAANALTRPGEISPVTQSKFGFHVIRLEERVPGQVVPKPELAELLGPDVLTRRSARARRELLERLRKSSVVDLERGVDELTARVKLQP